MEPDVYRTVSAPSTGLFKDKGSRFLAFAYPVSSVAEVKQLLENLRKEYHDARHHCYAYRIGPGGSEYRVSDDGEPANSAGKPILGQLQALDLTNTLVVVIRYFGGILLGVGGLIHAYRTAARISLDSAKIVEQTFTTTLQISFRYEAMNDIMKILKDSRAEIQMQDQGMKCHISASVRSGVIERLSAQLSHIEGVEVQDYER